MFYNFIKHLTSQKFTLPVLEKIISDVPPRIPLPLQANEVLWYWNQYQIHVRDYRKSVQTHCPHPTRISIAEVSSLHFRIRIRPRALRWKIPPVPYPAQALSHSSPDHTSGKSLLVSAVLLCDSSPRNLRRNMP